MSSKAQTSLTMDSDVDIVPHHITLRHTKLKLNWSDREATLDGPLLRASCRCAQCRSMRLKAGVPIDSPLFASATDADAVTVTAAVSMGYGLQLRFNDGHDRGIFPWSYLRELALS